MSPTDADQLGIAEGDWVEVASPRGAIEVRARIGRVTAGVVFAPFHYGTWDPTDRHRDHNTPDDHDPGDDPDDWRRRRRTANELAMTVWDPVSKQPTFKTAACRVTRLRAGNGTAPAPTTTASAPPTPTDARPTAGGAPTTSVILDTTPHYPLDPAQLQPTPPRPAPGAMGEDER